MGKVEDCCSTHLVYGDSTFNYAGIENFVKTVKFDDVGVSYVVVSIMGPQSSGKSTLLNHMFGTKFREMDASKGRGQTTKGIWIEKCADIEPSILLMDLEGTDGKERGEDDTAFEKRSTLFALAVSDIVLINMWCHDIGRESAANRPLLKTVFQVMLKMNISPRTTTCKTTLMFVIRDLSSKTPVEIVARQVREDIQEIWDSVPKPPTHKETPLDEFFSIEVVALSSYEDKEEDFKKEVASLRQRFIHSIAPGVLAGDRQAVAASGFSLSVQEIWKKIREEKDLDLPALKVLVAKVRCDEIANEKYSRFAAKEDWHQLEMSVQSGPIPNFGRTLSSLLDTCLSGYDADAMGFDEGVRSEKRTQLEEKLLQVAEPAARSMSKHILHGTLDEFKEAFDEALNRGELFSVVAARYHQSFMTLFDERWAEVVIERASWDVSNSRDDLQCQIDAYIASLRAAKLSELTSKYKEKVTEALSEPVRGLLDDMGNDTWWAIGELVQRENESTISGLSEALLGFEVDEQTRKEMTRSVEDYARGVVVAKAREEAGRILITMEHRFATLFNPNSYSMPRTEQDIQAIAKDARYASVELLALMAAIRLDGEADNIKNTLSSALVDCMNTSALDSSTWKEVPPSKTLITPFQCKSFWKEFITRTEGSVSEAIAQAREYIAKLTKLASLFEATLREALSGPLRDLFDNASDRTWLAIRELLQRETKSCVSGLSAALSSLQVDEETRMKMLTSLEDYARGVVEAKAAEEAGRILTPMKHKFEMLFNSNSYSLPRPGHDILAIAKAARSASLELLSVMAAIRLDGEADNIKYTLSCALMDSMNSSALDSSTWDEVPSSKTLITPSKCKCLWEKFIECTEGSVSQAIAQANSAMVYMAELSKLTSQCEEKLMEALSCPVGALFYDANDSTWLAISELLQRETNSAVLGLSAALSDLNVDEETRNKMLTSLEEYAIRVVEVKAKEEAGKIQILMEHRFATLFSRDSHSEPQTENHIQAIAKTARSACLELLSVMAAIRLNGKPDNIKSTLSFALVDSFSSPVLDSTTWEQVPSEKTLITPVQCKYFWEQFMAITEHNVALAVAAHAYAALPGPAQEAPRRDNRRGYRWMAGLVPVVSAVGTVISTVLGFT